MNSSTKAEELYQLLKRYAVTCEFRPLAIGVKEEIQAAFPEFTLEDVAVVLRRHCKHGKYLTALVRGEQRFHLNGEPAGAIKQLHKDKAAALLETQKKRRAAREQALKAPPKKVEPKAFEPPKPKPQITAAAPKTPDQISPDVSGTRPKLTLKKKGGQP